MSTYHSDEISNSSLMFWQEQHQSKNVSSNEQSEGAKRSGNTNDTRIAKFDAVA
jgi:hypothetical protein